MGDVMVRTVGLLRWAAFRVARAGKGVAKIIYTAPLPQTTPERRR